MDGIRRFCACWVDPSPGWTLPYPVPYPVPDPVLRPVSACMLLLSSLARQAASPTQVTRKRGPSPSPPRMKNASPIDWGPAGAGELGRYKASRRWCASSSRGRTRESGMPGCEYGKLQLTLWSSSAGRGGGESTTVSRQDLEVVITDATALFGLALDGGGCALAVGPHRVGLWRKQWLDV